MYLLTICVMFSQYIILEDIMDLMGSDALQSEDDMRRMWGDGIKAVKSKHARITYDDFLLLMKGQTKEGTPSQELERDPESSVSSLMGSTSRLHSVPEAIPSCESPHTPTRTITLPSGDIVTVDGTIMPNSTIDEAANVPVFRSPSPLPFKGSQSAPNTPLDHKRVIEFNLESPLSIDEDITSSGPGVPGCAQSLTPPMSPTRGFEDFVTPGYEHRTMVDFRDLKDNNLMLPGLPKSAAGTPIPPPYTRRRSRSVGEQEQENETSESRELQEVADVVRDLLLPESGNLGEIGRDESKSALVVNRKLYRAHRQMRLAVVEASKRFEEQQAEHARDVILAAREGEDDKEASHGMIQAGLVMRHGHIKQVSSKAIRKLLEENRTQQLKQVEKANRRGGRGRRSRKKTTSDMSGMLNSMGQEDLKVIAQKAALDKYEEKPMPAETLYEDMVTLPDVVDPEELTAEGQIRGPTVPGEFRKTSDPFGKSGRYGAVAGAW